MARVLATKAFLEKLGKIDMPRELREALEKEAANALAMAKEDYARMRQQKHLGKSFEDVIAREEARVKRALELREIAEQRQLDQEKARDNRKFQTLINNSRSAKSARWRDEAIKLARESTLKARDARSVVQSARAAVRDAERRGADPERVRAAKDAVNRLDRARRALEAAARALSQAAKHGATSSEAVDAGYRHALAAREMQDALDDLYEKMKELEKKDEEEEKRPDDGDSDVQVVAGDWMTEEECKTVVPSCTSEKCKKCPPNMVCDECSLEWLTIPAGGGGVQATASMGLPQMLVPGRLPAQAKKRPVGKSGAELVPEGDDGKPLTGEEALARIKQFVALLNADLRKLSGKCDDMEFDWSAETQKDSKTGKETTRYYLKLTYRDKVSIQQVIANKREKLKELEPGSEARKELGDEIALHTTHTQKAGKDVTAAEATLAVGVQFAQFVKDLNEPATTKGAMEAAQVHLVGLDFKPKGSGGKGRDSGGSVVGVGPSPAQFSPESLDTDAGGHIYVNVDAIAQLDVAFARRVADKTKRKLSVEEEAAWTSATTLVVSMAHEFREFRVGADMRTKAPRLPKETPAEFANRMFGTFEKDANGRLVYDRDGQPKVIPGAHDAALKFESALREELGLKLIDGKWRKARELKSWANRDGIPDAASEQDWNVPRLYTGYHPTLRGQAEDLPATLRIVVSADDGLAVYDIVVKPNGEVQEVAMGGLEEPPVGTKWGYKQSVATEEPPVAR